MGSRCFWLALGVIAVIRRVLVDSVDATDGHVVVIYRVAMILVAAVCWGVLFPHAIAGWGRFRGRGCVC